MLDPHVDGRGYFQTVLTKDKKKKKFSIHRLVFITFINENIQKEKVIDHINRIKTDNRVENLREATRSENAKNVDPIVKKSFDPISQYTKDGKLIRHWKGIDEILENHPEYNRSHLTQSCNGNKHSAYGYVWEYKDYVYDLKGYRPVKTDDDRKYSYYMINKNGNVINKHGRPIKQILNEYYDVPLKSDCGYRRHFTVHRLVAITFIPNPDNKPLVNHKDENKFNNHKDNLEWTTPSGNSAHSLGKKVQQIDPETDKIIATFNTITEAFESLERGKGNPWGIGRTCAGRQELAYRYKWQFAE